MSDAVSSPLWEVGDRCGCVSAELDEWTRGNVGICKTEAEPCEAYKGYGLVGFLLRPTPIESSPLSTGRNGGGEGKGR